MVKRTLMVLGILMVVMVNTVGAQMLPSPWSGCDNKCAPCFVPVDCRIPEPTTIIKTWSINIDGPCPAPGVACGKSCETRSCLDPCSLLTSIGCPILDCLFGGWDGVYGCFGGSNCGSACGPCFGPVPAAVAAVPMCLGARTVMFGCLW